MPLFSKLRPAADIDRRALILPWISRITASIVLLQLLSPCSPVALAVDADVLLRGGTIHDGTGAKETIGDVALRGDRIVAVGKFDVGQIGRTVDCTGLVIAPGFIDLHTHSDHVADKTANRPNLNYLMQGCTTVVTGNCGGGKLETAEFLDKVDKSGTGTNIIHLIPHGKLRKAAMGNDNRVPSPDELEEMKRLVGIQMKDGAWGMSTGLIYTPSAYAKTEEIIELSKVVAAHGGIYVSHIRNEGKGLLKSVDETIRIGREANVPVHISHFKVVGKPNWGLVRKAAQIIDVARRDGVVVTAEQYPYIATSTSLLATLFPVSQIPGGRSNLAQRMADDPDLEKTVRGILSKRLGSSHRIQIASCKKHPEYVGKGVREIAAEKGMDAIDLVLETQFDGGASVVNFSLSEDDVRWVMQLPWVATGSDGSAKIPNPKLSPHPRSFGTFPRKVGRYAIRDKVIRLPHAIRSCTGLPADILGLKDRGYLRPQTVADVLVFDPEEFIDLATFKSSQEYSAGVRYLFVGGQPTIDGGRRTDQLPGRALRHESRDR
jgi:N-acyl-D-amino-acid deacylase